MEQTATLLWYENVSIVVSMFGAMCCSAGPAMKYAVDLGADPKRTLAKKQTYLFVAAKRGDVEKVKAWSQVVMGRD